MTDEICDKLFYFEENPSELPTALEGNYCLVEDSKLDNLLLTSWANENHVNFIFDASFETDCPKDICTWLKQRRRWSNGDMAAVFTNTTPTSCYNMMSHGLSRTFACLDYQLNNLNRVTKWFETALVPIELCYLVGSYESFLAMTTLTLFTWLASALLPTQRAVYWILFFSFCMSSITSYNYTTITAEVLCSI